MKRSNCFLIILLAFSVTSCSLLKIQLSNGDEPLAKTDLNIRVFTHTFVNTFFAESELTTDSIRKVCKDPKVIANSVKWLINIESAVQSAVFQVNPRVALADTWILTEQMVDFIGRDGKKYFVNYNGLQLESATKMRNQVSVTAKRMLSSKDFSKMQEFVMQQSKSTPIEDIEFTRLPIYAKWLQFNNMPDTTAINSMGSLPEVISDFSDRFSVMGEQIAKVTSWQLEVASLRTGINAQSIKELGDSIDARVNVFMNLARMAPEKIDTALIQLNRDLMAMTRVMDYRVAQTMIALSKERMAIEEMFTRERAEVMVSLDSISGKLTKIVLEKATAMITKTLLSLSVLLAVIIFIPFAMGFYSGKLFGVYRNKKKKTPETFD